MKTNLKISRVDKACHHIGRASFRRTASGALCRLSVSVFMLLMWAATATTLTAGTEVTPTPTAVLAQPLSMQQTLEIALRQNPEIVRAQKDVEATEGVVVQTRAIALPQVQVAGNYRAVQPQSVDSPQVSFPGFSFGTDQNWLARVQLVQSLYEGGRLLSAFRTAKLTRERSLLNYQTVVADVVLRVQIAYFDVLLGKDQIAVQEASVELLRRELTDTTRRFDAGTVPRFNVLRAEVELANAQPPLIRARNNFRIAKNNLSNLLGYNLPKDTVEDIPLVLTDKLEADPLDLPLSQAIASGFERRTELTALAKTEGLRRENLVNARSGYKPSLQAFGGYQTTSSIFTSDLGYELHGWLAGVQVTWNLFDGLATQGRVKEAAALLSRTQVEREDALRRVELEVRTAYSQFIEAREVLESQKKVVQQAEEAVRLANAREEAGTATQLDVLSAQTALTQARSTNVQALRDYAAARAKLERAAGLTAPARPPQ